MRTTPGSLAMVTVNLTGGSGASASSSSSSSSSRGGCSSMSTCVHVGVVAAAAALGGVLAAGRAPLPWACAACPPCPPGRARRAAWPRRCCPSPAAAPPPPCNPSAARTRSCPGTPARRAGRCAEARCTRAGCLATGWYGQMPVWRAPALQCCSLRSLRSAARAGSRARPHTSASHGEGGPSSSSCGFLYDSFSTLSSSFRTEIRLLETDERACAVTSRRIWRERWGSSPAGWRAAG
jgi:hypothetical protein